MEEATKANSIFDFERAIYPIWAKIETVDNEAEKKLSSKEATSGLIMGECVTLHKQDLAIFKSGIKPHRIDIAQEKMNKLRAKAARASSFGG